jgi:hypothetical protein
MIPECYVDKYGPLQSRNGRLTDAMVAGMVIKKGK